MPCLAAHGARVAIIDRDATRVSEVTGRLADQGGAANLRGYAADIGTRAEVERVAAAIEQELGPVAVLVNNAAAKSPNFFAPFEEFPLDDWNEVMRVNLTGVDDLLPGHSAARWRAAAAAASSTRCRSTASSRPDQRIYEGSQYEGRAINTPAIYSASKAGLWGLTKYLASYWGAQGVRVNAVTPGGVFSGQNDTFVGRYAARVPLGRMAQARRDGRRGGVSRFRRVVVRDRAEPRRGWRVDRMVKPRCFVIAEAGVNHNGSLDLALRLVDVAADAGADAVKFQTFSRRRRSSGRARRRPRIRSASTGAGDQCSMLKALELSREHHELLSRKCAELRIEFMSTPFDESALDMLVELGVRRMKVASGELTNKPFLRQVAACGLPIILSTGMGAERRDCRGARLAARSGFRRRSRCCIARLTIRPPSRT